MSQKDDTEVYYPEFFSLRLTSRKMKLLRTLFRFLLRRRQAKPLTAWQQIFIQSKANGGYYDGDSLPVNKWEWPKR